MTDDGADHWGKPAEPAHYRLRLYVTGATPRSVRAIENLRLFCEGELEGCYDLEIVDIYQNPLAARDAQVIAAPMLVKMKPEPVRRIIGDMSDRGRVRRGLNMREGEASDASEAQ